MERDYKTFMKARPDADLIRISSGLESDDYEPAAVEAAKAELLFRNISDDEYSDEVSGIETRLHQQLNRDKIPLGRFGKALAFIFSGFLVPIIIIILYTYGSGYKKKAMDAVTFMVFGWIFLLTISTTIYFTSK